jgi:hypothetical protein
MLRAATALCLSLAACLGAARGSRTSLRVRKLGLKRGIPQHVLEAQMAHFLPADPLTGVQPGVLGNPVALAASRRMAQTALEEGRGSTKLEVKPFAEYGTCGPEEGGLMPIASGALRVHPVAKVRAPGEEPGGGGDPPRMMYGVLNALHLSLHTDRRASKRCAAEPEKHYPTSAVREVEAVVGEFLPSEIALLEGREACFRVLFEHNHETSLPRSGDELYACAPTRQERREWIASLTFELQLAEKAGRAAAAFRHATVSAETLAAEMEHMRASMGSPAAMRAGAPAPSVGGPAVAAASEELPPATAAQFFQYYFPAAPETLCAHGGLACLTAPERLLDRATGLEATADGLASAQFARSSSPLWAEGDPIVADARQRWAITPDPAVPELARICRRARPLRCLTAPPTVLATVHVSKDPEGGMPGVFCEGADYDCFESEESIAGGSPELDAEGAAECQGACRDDDGCRAWTFAAAGRNGTATEAFGRCCLKESSLPEDVRCSGGEIGNSGGEASGGETREGFWSGLKNVFLDEERLVDAAAVDGGPDRGSLLLRPPSASNSQAEAAVAGPEALGLWIVETYELPENRAPYGKPVTVAEIRLSRGERCLTAAVPGATVEQALFGRHRESLRVVGPDGETEGEAAAEAGIAAAPTKVAYRMPSDLKEGETLSAPELVAARRKLGLGPDATMEDVRAAQDELAEARRDEEEDEEEEDDEDDEDEDDEDDEGRLRFRSARAGTEPSAGGEARAADPSLSRIVGGSASEPSEPAAPKLWLQRCNRANPGQAFIAMGFARPEDVGGI